MTSTRRILHLRHVAVAALLALSLGAPTLVPTASAAPDIFTPIPLRTVTINNVSVTEPGSGSRSAGVFATLHGEPLHPGETLTVHYHTQDDTATGGSDYVTVIDGSVTFVSGGPSSLLLDVSVLHDTDDTEHSETFTVHADRIGFVEPVGTVTIDPPGGGDNHHDHCDQNTQQIILCI